MTKLPVYDKYFTKEDVDYYYKLFIDAGLHPFVDPPSETFNAIFGNTQVDLQYVLRIPVNEFKVATKLIEDEIRKAELPNDYYLHDFTDAELYEILKNPVEWSRQDTIAAKVILESRNFSIDLAKLEDEKIFLKQEEKNKKKISLPVLILFYLVAPLGAFLPVFVGLLIYFLKDTDLDGQRDFVFSNKYRQHGLALAAIGIFSMWAWLYVFRFNIRG